MHTQTKFHANPAFKPEGTLTGENGSTTDPNPSSLPETQSYSYTRYNAEILQTYCAQCEAARDGYQEPREDAVRTGHEPN